MVGTRLRRLPAFTWHRGRGSFWERRLVRSRRESHQQTTVAGGVQVPLGKRDVPPDKLGERSCFDRDTFLPESQPSRCCPRL